MSVNPQPNTNQKPANQDDSPNKLNKAKLNKANLNKVKPSQPNNRKPIAATPRATFILIIVAIVLLAANMRAPFVALGSIAPIVQEAIHIDEWYIGWLGAIPMLMFALGAFVAPSIGKRFGLENTLIIALTMLTIGTILRVVWVSWYGFLVGTILLSFAIAFANTLAAPIIKQRAPDHIALVTGLLSLTMSMMAGIAAGVVFPLAKLAGWQWALGGWALLSLLATVVWIVLRVKVGSSHRLPSSMETLASTDTPKYNNDGVSNHTQPFSMWRSPLAWQLAVFMGLQSSLFYTVASFLPSIWLSKGLTQTQGGSMGSVFQFMAPIAIISMTWLIRRGLPIQTVAVVASVFNVMGALGLLLFTVKLAWLWTAFLGIGCAGIFTLCMMLFSLRTYSPSQASKLSGMVQSVAYLIAFLGPFGTGWLHTYTAGWTVPLVMMLLLTVINVGFAWLSSRPIMIDGRPA